MEISLELKLALACCRWSFSHDDAEEIAHLSSSVDWPRFIQTMRRHRVQGLVNKAFQKLQISLPSSIATAVQRDATSIASSNLLFANESRRILDSFAEAGVPILFVKGLTLSSLAYQDPYVKMSSDIDVLVDDASTGRAAELLTGLGYFLVQPAMDSGSADLRKWHRTHKESVWCRAETNVTVELHTRLSDNPAIIPAIGLSSRRQQVLIGGGHSLPTLAIDDLLIYLCVHGASSAWFRMKWIADLAALIYSLGIGGPQLVRSVAEKRDAGRAPAQALLLLDRLLLFQLPNALRTELERDPINRLLSNIAFRLLLTPGEPTERPFGTAWIHLTQPLLYGDWIFRFLDTSRRLRDVVDGAR